MRYTKYCGLRSRFAHEFRSYDHGRRNAELLKVHSVVRTARRAGASISDCDQCNIIVCRDIENQFGCGWLCERLFLVTIDLRKFTSLAKQPCHAVEKPRRVPFCIVQN